MGPKNVYFANCANRVKNGGQNARDFFVALGTPDRLVFTVWVNSTPSPSYARVWFRQSPFAARATVTGLKMVYFANSSNSVENGGPCNGPKMDPYKCSKQR